MLLNLIFELACSIYYFALHVTGAGSFPPPLSAKKEIELTERCRQLERKYLKLVIDNMKKYGIKFALDDFGTGFSSLNLLSEIAVDTLKIDRGFIFDIQENAANQAIVKAVTNCANELKIHVCAEGIEDKVLADFVKKYGVHSFQGYYYSKPAVYPEFAEKYLKK